MPGYSTDIFASRMMPASFVVCSAMKALKASGDGDVLKTHLLEALGEEDLVLVGARQTLAGFGAAIHWRDLPALPLIMTPGIHDFVQKWADEQFVRLNVVHRVNSIHAIMQTLKAGQFCSVVPFSVFSQRDDVGKLGAVPLADPPITRRLVTAYSASRPLSPPMLAVHDLLADAVRRVRLKVADGGPRG